MLGPGSDDEGFDEPICILHVTENVPTPRTVATSNSSMFTDRCKELRGFFRCNLIFDGDKHWTEVVVRRQDLVLGGWQSPVIPGSQIDGRLRQAQEWR